MLFQEIHTPEQLMTYLDQNFDYGVMDSKGNRYYDSNTSIFQKICNTQWKLRSVDEILKDGIGHCYDQVEVERAWFSKNGFELKTFWIVAYLEGVENSGLCHTYLLFQEGTNWKLFEHADSSNRGIFEFKSMRDAVKWQANHQIDFAKKYVNQKKHYKVCIKEYNTPPQNVNMQDFLQFVDKSKEYEL